MILGKESHVGRLRSLPRQGGGRRGGGRLAPRRGRVLHATNASAVIDRRRVFESVLIYRLVRVWHGISQSGP